MKLTDLGCESRKWSQKSLEYGPNDIRAFAYCLNVRRACFADLRLNVSCFILLKLTFVVWFYQSQITKEVVAKINVNLLALLGKNKLNCTYTKKFFIVGYKLLYLTKQLCVKARRTSVGVHLALDIVLKMHTMILTR